MCLKKNNENFILNVSQRRMYSSYFSATVVAGVGAAGEL